MSDQPSKLDEIAYRLNQVPDAQHEWYLFWKRAAVADPYSAEHLAFHGLYGRGAEWLYATRLFKAGIKR